MERSEHGNRSDTKTDYPFQLLCFLKLHTYTRVQREMSDAFLLTYGRQSAPHVHVLDEQQKWLLPDFLYLGLALLEESVTQALRPAGYSESDPVQNPNHSVLTLHGWRLCLGLCSGLIPWNLSLRPNWDKKRFANSWRWSLGGCGAGCLNNKRMAGLWFHLDRLLFFPLFALLCYSSLSRHIELWVCISRCPWMASYLRTRDVLYCLHPHTWSTDEE